MVKCDMRIRCPDCGEQTLAIDCKVGMVEALASTIDTCINAIEASLSLDTDYLGQDRVQTHLNKHVTGVECDTCGQEKPEVTNEFF